MPVRNNRNQKGINRELEVRCLNCHIQIRITPRNRLLKCPNPKCGLLMRVIDESNKSNGQVGVAIIVIKGSIFAS